MKNSHSLTREQKEAVGLLSIGTFLEYFDLMLYVHMAVLLNELFFPKADPETQSLLSAFAFCSSYLFRPIGALIFGYIGDKIGRKVTVVITVFMMAGSCIIIAGLPTYDQIGISAAWIVTICRIVQGMACIGETAGSEIYLTETTKPPYQYPIVAIVTVSTAVGTSVALAVASLVTSFGLNWRLAFLFGAGVALVGSVARTSLRETPEFVDATRRKKKSFAQEGRDFTQVENSALFQEHVSKKTMLAYFFIQCTRPICFYFAYIHCGDIFRERFGFSAEQVIHNNLVVSIIDLAGLAGLAFLSFRIYPLKILKFKWVIFCSFLLSSPYLLSQINDPIYLTVIQIFAVLFAFDDMPAVPIFYKHFPVFKRFTYSSWLHAVARALVYPFMSFGLVFLSKYCGDYALLVLATPLSLTFLWGLLHFETLELANGNHIRS